MFRLFSLIHTLHTCLRLALQTYQQKQASELFAASPNFPNNHSYSTYS